ncbi:MAG: alpha/beta hydrolase, partial [Balneolales bacterium]|nr:alpha/beta hydrolase [Balneolales bacterium]
MNTRLANAGIRKEFIQTKRLKTACLIAGNPENIPVILIHGNTSNSIFWAPLMEFLAQKYYVIAPDLASFGDTEFRPISAATGVQDWSDDIIALADQLLLPNISIMTHSMGGIIGWDLLRRYSQRVDWMVQIAPGSPFGFGGTKDAIGTRTWSDFAGSGAGLVNKELIKAIQQNSSDMSFGVASPRSLLKKVILREKNPTSWEDELVDGMLKTRVGTDAWPGEIQSSHNWPGFSPGSMGVVNALSPKNLSHLQPALHSKFWNESDHSSSLPHVTWIRGEYDVLVSDASVADVASQGDVGAVEGYPGKTVFPPQPMIQQIRAYLNSYAAFGGSFTEHVVPETGHSPHIEKP